MTAADVTAHQAQTAKANRRVCCQATAEQLQGHLVQNHPVGVDLGVALRVQDDRLIGSEVCQRDLSALWTHVNQIHHCVVIKVVLTDVSDAVH